MNVTVMEIVEQDSFVYKQGPMAGQTAYGVKFVATDDEGNQHWLGVNTKKPDAVRTGDRFGFLSNGNMAGKWTLGRREQGTLQSGGGQSTLPTQRAPQNGSVSATGASSNVPTITERGKEILALAPRALKLAQAIAVGGASPDAICGLQTSILMHWLIGKDQGRIKDDPTADEVAAAEAAKQARLAEAKRILEEAEKKAALDAMPPLEADDEIPF